MGDTMALIPARAGSVGLPGKNRRVLVDRPLTMHSVACARLMPSVQSILLSTDDVLLAEIAGEQDVWIPELRPSTLATDSTPMADVIRYAVDLSDRVGQQPISYLLLLDPTSPCRDPQAIEAALARLREDPTFDGVVSVSRPSFNPLWVGVTVTEAGQLNPHPMLQESFTRRQDVPDYWRINGSFYVWRMDYARSIGVQWPREGRFLAAPMADLLSHSIDTLEDFLLVEALLSTGTVTLPWMNSEDSNGAV